MIASLALANDDGRQGHYPRLVAVLRRDRSQSLELAASLRESGISAVDVENLVPLSKLIAAKLVKLLIIDNQIEGFVTGMEVVRKLRAQFIRVPVILVDSNVELLREESNFLGPITFSDASTTTDEIAKVARRILSRPLNELGVIPERARVLVERQVDLPLLPQLVVRLVGYLQTPVDEVPVDEMCRFISIDPKATVLLLKAANASANGLLREAANVQDAVRLLGVRRSIGQILSAAIVDGMRALANGLPMDEQNWHARRGMLIASASATLSEEIDHRPGEATFLLGLLQDVGILALLRAYPREYRAVLKRWRMVGHLKLPIIERSALGCTHADLSAAMMERWQLPASLFIPVLHHLEPSRDAERLGVDPGLHRVMTIAEAMADSIDAPHASRRHALVTLLGQYDSDAQRACRQSLMRATAKAAEASRLLDLPVPSAHEIESMVRWALSMEFQSTEEGLILPAPSGHVETLANT